MTTTPAFPADEIWQRLDPAVPWKGDWTDFRHRQQGEFLHELAKYSSFDVGLSHIGTSDEGRVLHTLRFGAGKKRVLLWARQHGDEPDCTAGLAMALYELILRGEEPVYQFIRQRLELGVFPMVNPDGVARFTRRNAQGIDVNRDAVAAATSEGRAILAIKDSLQPHYCFNLHDMSPRKSTGDRKLVALAFQAGPFEPRDIDNDVRLRAKTIIGHMAAVARPHAEGHLAKYTADYMHRAFGDSMMRMGVSSILIEAGGWYGERGGDDFVRRLFALTLLRGLHAIAAGEDEPAEGASYEAIPYDSGSKFSDVKLHGGRVLTGTGSPPFRSDIAINVDWRIGRINEPVVPTGSIEILGDLEDQLAIKDLSIAGGMAMPGLIAVAPSPMFERDRPSIEEAADFLRAGVTTIVTGFGPFGSNRAREQWLESVAATAPPLNVIAFERVSSLREIRSRHGMTELAGLLVQDLEISADDLLNFMHLFHPAHHSAIANDYAGRTIGIDLFFQGAASPHSTHMHLHLSPVQERSGRTPVRPEELRALVDDFLRSPSQITLTGDAQEQSFDWLPLLIGLGGLSHGRTPGPGFFADVMRRYGATDASGLVAALNMLTLTNARAFRLGHVGRIGIGQRADVVVFDGEVERAASEVRLMEPRLVLLDGRVVYDRAVGLSVVEGLGQWHFAAIPQVR